MIKFKILDIKSVIDTYEVSVVFNYGFKKIPVYSFDEETQEEKQIDTKTIYKTKKENFQLPINMTKKQILDFLELRYNNVYQTKNYLVDIEDEIMTLKGFES